MVAISPSGTLHCAQSECGDSNDGQQQLVRFHQDGNCYALSSTGPCPNFWHPQTNFVGFDVFERRAQCVDITAPDSPYFSSVSEDAFLDSTFNQMYAQYDDYRVSLVQQQHYGRRNGSAADSRQDTNTAGVFQLPGSLLNPCRTGSRNGNNFKCTAPVL